MSAPCSLASTCRDYKTQSFSMRGQATWPQGFTVGGEVLGQQNSGESAFPEYDRLKEKAFLRKRLATRGALHRMG